MSNDRMSNDSNRTLTRGVHHVAFMAPDLEVVLERLTHWPGVEIEFEPESLGGGPTRHLMCAIPGGIRVELIAPAAS